MAENKVHQETQYSITQYVHWTLTKENRFEVSQKWCKWSLESNGVIENSTTKILWEVFVRTDETVKSNRPVIILMKKDLNITYLIEVIVPQDYNVRKKEGIKRNTVSN